MSDAKKLVSQVEDQVGKIVKPLPSLPAEWRKWLGENVWWLALVGVILGAVALISTVQWYFNAMSVLSAFGAWANVSLNPFSGWSGTVALLELILAALLLVVTAVAIAPLKAKQSKGWNILFVSYLLGTATAVLGAVLVFNVAELLIAALIALVGGYFLFQIRDTFKKSTKKVTSKK